MTNDQTFKSCSSLMAGTAPHLTIVTANELSDTLNEDGSGSDE
jgi:hypothetical protein